MKELAREVDAVHVHSVFTVYAGLVIANSSASSRIVVTPHYHGTGHTFARRVLWTFWRWRVAELLKRASIVHAVSKREASILASHYPEAESKIVAIPNGVDEDVLSYRWQGQSSNYMVYAGRVEKYKRLELAVDVAKELNLKLIIIGKGPYREKLMRHASEVCGGGVEFLEPQPRERYLELVSRARYAINPSKHEAFSIFAAEALACGVPVITTAIAEFKIWYKQGVYLCNNFEELEKLLSLIIKSEEEVRRTLIEYSHQFRELFSWDNLADKFINE